MNKNQLVSKNIQLVRRAATLKEDCENRLRYEENMAVRMLSTRLELFIESMLDSADCVIVIP